MTSLQFECPLDEADVPDAVFWLVKSATIVTLKMRY
jgi:hypothetical protein